MKLHTARGPFRAILFLLMFSIAASGIAVLPSLMMGVTSTDSQVIGVCDWLLVVVSQCITGGVGIKVTNLGGSKDVLDGDGNLGADTITLDEADEVVAL